MKCPHCLSNKRAKLKHDLKTLRTLANGKTVKRERVCPRCEMRCDTIEIFIVDNEQERFAARDVIENYRSKAEKAEDVLEEVRDAAGVFARLGRPAGE